MRATPTPRSKKDYNILTDYFHYLTQQECIQKNPMAADPMIKESNFIASQGKEDLPTFETVTIFTPEEIAKFKAEAFRTRGNEARIYQQAAAYTLMLNTGLRTGEVLGLLNSNIDLEKRVIHLQQAGCAPQPGCGKGHLGSENGAVLRRGYAAHR